MIEADLAILGGGMHAQFTHNTAALRNLWRRHPSEAVRRQMAYGFRELSPVA